MNLTKTLRIRYLRREHPRYRYKPHKQDVLKYLENIINSKNTFKHFEIYAYLINMSGFGNQDRIRLRIKILFYEKT
jgi:hypothetical protein